MDISKEYNLVAIGAGIAAAGLPLIASIVIGWPLGLCIAGIMLGVGQMISLCGDEGDHKGIKQFGDYMSVGALGGFLLTGAHSMAHEVFTTLPPEKWPNLAPQF